MAANILEKLMLTLGADERSAASWGRVGTSIAGVAKSLWNVVKQYDKLAEVSNIYSSSADDSFENLSETALKLSTRLKSITSDFTATNVALETLGGAGDVVNHVWKEMGITAERWNTLAENKLVLTTIKLYAAYKILSFTVGTAANAFYKVGAALADNIKTQQQAGESIARMTGNTSKLYAEMERVARVRVYAAAAKNLSALGKLWESTTRATSMAAAAVEYLAAKFVALGTSIPGVNALLGGFTELLDGFTAVVKDGITNQNISSMFDVRSFQNADEAITHVRENLYAWSQETKVSSGEIQAAWEGMSRKLGDVKLGSELLTAAIANISSRGNVSGLETLQIFQKIADGAALSTEEIRALGVNINTASDDMLRSAKIMDLVINKMVSSSHNLDAVKFGENLQKNFHIYIGMLEQDVTRFSALEKQITGDMVAQVVEAGKLSKTSAEDRIRYLDLVKRTLGEYAAQQERVNALIGAQKRLEGATIGVGVADRYVQQIADLQARVEKARILFNDGGKESARVIYAAVREGYAELYSGITESGKQFLTTMQNSIDIVNNLVNSMGDVIPTDGVEDIVNLLDTQNKRAVEAFRQRWEFSKQELSNTQKGTEEYAQRASAIASLAQQFRSQMVAASNESIAVVNSAKQSIMEIYDLEGQGIKNNLEARIAAYDEEIRYALRMQQMYKASAAERIQFLQREVQARKRAVDEARNQIAQSSGDVLMKSGGVSATERAFEGHFRPIVKWIEQNPGKKLSEQFRVLVEKMGPQYQAAVRTALQTSEARRFEELRGVVESVRSRSGNSIADFEAALKRTGLKKEDMEIILGRQQELFQSIGVKQLAVDAKREDPFEGLQEAVLKFEDVIKLGQKQFEDSQSARIEFDAREAESLVKITEAVAQVTDAGAKFQDYTDMLDKVFGKISETFGVTVNQFGEETRTFGAGVQTLDDLVRSVKQSYYGSETGLQQEGDVTSLTPNEAPAVADSAQVKAIRAAVEDLVKEQNASIAGVLSSTDSRDSKIAQIETIISSYRELFGNATQLAKELSFRTGFDDSATFRASMTRGVAEVAKRAIEEQQKALENRDSFVHDGLGRAINANAPFSFIPELLGKATRIDSPKESAELGMALVERVTDTFGEGTQGATLRNEMLDLGFNIRKTLVDSVQNLNRYAGSQQEIIDRRDRQRSEQRPEIRLETPPSKVPEPSAKGGGVDDVVTKIIAAVRENPSRLNDEIRAAISGLPSDMRVEVAKALKNIIPQTVSGERISVGEDLSGVIERSARYVVAEMLPPIKSLRTTSPASAVISAVTPEAAPTVGRAVDRDPQNIPSDSRALSEVINRLSREQLELGRANAFGYFDKRIELLGERINTLITRRDQVNQQSAIPRVAPAVTPVVAPQPKAEKLDQFTPSPAASLKAEPETRPQSTSRAEMDAGIVAGLRLLEDLNSAAHNILAIIRSTSTGVRDTRSVNQIFNIPQSGDSLERLRNAFNEKGRGAAGPRPVSKY
jgi:hypothetical protein